MSREEAIAFFKDMNECTYGNLEEVEMAIQALQAQDKADTAYDRGYDKGYDDGFFDYEVCHKCKHFEYDELFIDETGEERDTSYCGRQAQADGEYILKKDVMCCIGQTSLHWELARKLRELPSVAIPTMVYPQVDGITPTVVAQADGNLISKSKMLMFLNDMRFGIAPDETVADDNERREREAQVDALDDLMEVVEQMPTVAIPSAEPCEDAISRQAVIDLVVANHTELNGVRVVMYSPLCKDIKQLPSVKQEPKTGHWIWDSKSNVYRCSCCNQFPWRIDTEENDEVFIDMERTNAYKFCPNCGTDMRGEQNE